ncbi:PepSY-associated TM helix domain-containing protein [Lacibacter luteus]|uniref:PepSY-associated TM helix domain-containing protein n=1 Tax=Lacibacter luteus TaxID=2508719 RepID=UPI0013E984DF|nr:PepSY-associated TM helix domain-containing protein [Lacibacter luteus]
MKKLIAQIHLWLGLVVGLIIIIIALSGAIYCFAPELQNLTQSYRKVEAQNTAFLPPSHIKQIAEKQLPGKPAKRIYYGSKEQSVQVLFRDKEKYSYSVFIDPYNGRVLKVRNNKKDFFSVTLDLHRTLLIPHGHEVVRWSTVAFFLIIVSGIVIWWPRNKRAAKQGFVLKLNASPKRLNYDLHRVLGFYASWAILLTVFTGLIWTFDSFADLTYKLTGAKRSVVQKKPPVSDTTLLSNADALNTVWANVHKDLHQRYAAMLFVLPDKKSDPILLRANPENRTLYKTDFRYFDRNSAVEISGAYVWGNYADAKTMADQIKRMNYDIHTGAAWGLPGRIALFFAALIVASLPVTGFYIWWGKKKKKKTTAKRSVHLKKQELEPVLV